MLNNRNREFSTNIFNQHFSNVNSLFADSLRVEQTTLSMVKISSTLKRLSCHVMGNPALRMFKVLNCDVCYQSAYYLYMFVTYTVIRSFKH